MSRLIAALRRSAIKKTTRKKTTIKVSKNKNFAAETEYLNLKAPSNNVKMQSEKNLNYINFFLPNYAADGDFN